MKKYLDMFWILKIKDIRMNQAIVKTRVLMIIQIIKAIFREKHLNINRNTNRVVLINQIIQLFIGYL